MTQRELDIYKIISDYPMITQKDLADQLGITRSAVSAYISGMITKGIIKGRGYVLAQQEYPVLIGPGHIDITMECNVDESFNDMFVSHTNTIAYGGAIKNAADYYVRLGGTPHALFTISSDYFGQNYLANCKEHGINVDDVLIVSDYSMPIYTEIRDENRKVLVSATTEDTLADLLSAKFLQSKSSALQKANYIVFHDALSTSASDYLTSTYQNCILFSTSYKDTVTHVKILPRLKTILSSYKIMLSLITGKDKHTKDYICNSSIMVLGRQLVDLGIGNAIIICPEDRILLIDNYSIQLYKSLFEMELKANLDKRYSHTRDAAIATLLCSYSQGHTIEQMLSYISAAIHIVSTSGSFVDSNFCTSLLEDCSKSITVLPIAGY